MSQDHEAGRQVGDRLRQAREQKGITVAEAGARLHILSSYINAMENGRYGVLPGTVFLRGYVRSYARLLELNEDEIVGQLDRELGASKEETAKTTEEKPVVVKRNYPHRWLLLIAVLLLLVGGVLQYQHLQAPSDDVTGATVESGESQVQTEDADSSAPGTPPAEPMPWADADDDAPVSRSAPYTDESSTEEDDQSRDTPESGGTNESSETNESRETNESGGMNTAGTDEAGSPGTVGTLNEIPAEEPSADISVAQPGDARVESAAPTVSAIPSTTPESVPATPGSDQLDVTFSGECWFEVEDASGKRRRGLFEAGDTLEFQGRAPFTVVIGAASETQMVFNGVAVDYARYSVRNNRVGITLGQ